MHKTIHIEWLTKSSAMFDFINGKTEDQIRGGRLYEIEAIKVLKNRYQVTINSDYIKRENSVKYLLKNHTNKIKGTVCVVDPYVIALGKFKTNVKNIAIIHHIDETLLNKNFLSKSFYYNLIRNLKKMHTVVVVSEVWKTFLVNQGVKNVKVIYNAFNTSKYNFSIEEKNTFKMKYGLSDSKPIIYVGPNTSGKGVDEVLEVIEQNTYELITTGKTNSTHKGVKTFFFSDDEFPLFLSCCDLVLCMSKMTEGWNRIAHEALLTKTPVIGSGSGGMRELLEESGQIIIKDLTVLNEKIDECLSNSITYAEAGYKFTSKFDLDYFKSSWENLIEDVS